MLKCGFGLKDAPRLWQQARRKLLLKAGLRSLQADEQMYVLFHNDKLQLLVSTHVDDLKGAGEKWARDHLIEMLEEAFGKLKTQFCTLMYRCAARAEP